MKNSFFGISLKYTIWGIGWPVIQIIVVVSNMASGAMFVRFESQLFHLIIDIRHVAYIFYASVPSFVKWGSKRNLSHRFV